MPELLIAADHSNRIYGRSLTNKKADHDKQAAVVTRTVDLSDVVGMKIEDQVLCITINITTLQSFTDMWHTIRSEVQSRGAAYRTLKYSSSGEGRA